MSSLPYNYAGALASAQLIGLDRPEAEVLAELDAACISDGFLQPMPAAFYAARPQAELGCWCVRRGFYNLPTVELIDWLREEIGGELAIEIACGHGAIGRALHIPLTDSRSHDDPRLRAHYANIKQAPTICPDDVVKMSALQAIERYEPTVVVLAWGVWKFNPARPNAGGSENGIAFGRVLGKPSVQKLIVIAHERVHAPIDILELDHHTIRKPWLFGRAMDTAGNVIWVWGER